jgi:hypothetical protein
MRKEIPDSNSDNEKQAEDEQDPEHPGQSYFLVSHPNL